MTIVAKRPEAIGDLVDGRMVLCDTRSGELFDLNDTGVVIWDFCDGKAPEAIAAHLEQLYVHVDPRKVAADVEAYLVALENAGLAERCQ